MWEASSQSDLALMIRKRIMQARASFVYYPESKSTRNWVNVELRRVVHLHEG